MNKKPPTPKLSKTILSYFNPRDVFIAALCTIILTNSWHLHLKIKDMKQKVAAAPYVFLGNKFSGMDQFLKDVKTIGYYTDKDLDQKKHSAQFSQAQYILVPIILDLDYEKHEYIVFDCTSERVAYERIRELKAHPLKRNQYGIVLARQKK